MYFLVLVCLVTLGSVSASQLLFELDGGTLIEATAVGDRITTVVISEHAIHDFNWFVNEGIATIHHKEDYFDIVLREGFWSMHKVSFGAVLARSLLTSFDGPIARFVGSSLLTVAGVKLAQTHPKVAIGAALISLVALPRIRNSLSIRIATREVPEPLKSMLKNSVEVISSDHPDFFREMIRAARFVHRIKDADIRAYLIGFQIESIRAIKITIHKIHTEHSDVLSSAFLILERLMSINDYVYEIDAILYHAKENKYESLAHTMLSKFILQKMLEQQNLLIDSIETFKAIKTDSIEWQNLIIFILKAPYLNQHEVSSLIELYCHGQSTLHVDPCKSFEVAIAALIHKI